MKKNRLNIATALALLTLATVGCASSKPITTGSGQQGYYVSCSLGNRGHCLEEAGSLCGDAGYTMLERESDPEVESFLSGSDKRMVVVCR